MKNVPNFFVTVALVLVPSFILWGQRSSSEELRKQQQELQKKISYTETLLMNTSISKQNLADNIGLIDRKIEYRRDLLDNLRIQMTAVENDIEEVDLEILRLTTDLAHQKEQLRLMIQKAYKMRNSKASLLFVLSSESFNQANRRMEYLDQLTQFRSNQIRRINASKVQLENHRLELDLLRLEKDRLFVEQQKEHEQYIADRKHQEKSILALTNKEKQLQTELQEQHKKDKKLQDEINRVLNEEFLAKKKKEKENPRNETELKEIELIGIDFESNKGRLPSPVLNGTVTRGFGKQAHPVHKTVFVDNKGIDITTVRGATVRAVFAGEVSGVVVIPGAGKAIILSHGNYRTVYCNLQETYVQEGDKVKVKQELGALLVNGSGNSEVHFEIRKITTTGDILTVNPTYWLYQ